MANILEPFAFDAVYGSFSGRGQIDANGKQVVAASVARAHFGKGEYNEAITWMEKGARREAGCVLALSDVGLSLRECRASGGREASQGDHTGAEGRGARRAQTR
jgi:hypothetical protein